MRKILSWLLVCTFVLGFMPMVAPITAEAAVFTITTPTFAARWPGMVAIKTDGSVWKYDAWGETSVKFNGSNNAVEVAAGGGDMGEEAFYVLKSDKTLWSYSLYGGGYDEPTKVKDNIIHVSANYFSMVAIDANHDLWKNSNKIMSGVADVTGNAQFALKTDGSVWDLENNSKVMSGVIKIDSHSTFDGAELFALKSDGSMWVWGNSDINYNNAGTPNYETWTDPDTGKSSQQLIGYDFNIPSKIADNITSMSCGVFGLLAKKTDKTMWHWQSSTGKQINIGNDVVDFSCAVGWNGGCNYAVFLKSDGSLWAFGDVDGTYNSTPVKVMDGIKMPGNIPGGDTIDGGDEPIITNAATPNITTQPSDVAVNIGSTATLKVAASVSKGALSYQWYSNTTKSNTGGTPIGTGATSSTYNPWTDVVGTKYYYCVIKNTDNTATGNKTASIASNAVQVTVNNSFTPKRINNVSFSFFAGKNGNGEKTDVQFSGLDISYDDEYFRNSSYNYNHGLSRMSLALALTAFNSAEAGKRNYNHDDAGNNVGDLLLRTEFKNIDVFSYAGKPSENSIAAAFGSKPSWDGSTLIAVAVRGGGYEKEWIGNFNLSGQRTYHDGFQTAADQVFNKLATYINQQKISGKIKIWIVGYSRGAATANLVAANLDDGNLPRHVRENITLSNNDIYAYTFETPQNTKNVSARDNKYLNIFNIINPIDVVTKVAMSGFGYSRYGSILVLPAAETTSKAKINDVLSLYNSFIGKRNGKETMAWLPTLSIQAERIDMLMEGIVLLGYGSDKSHTTQLLLSQVRANISAAMGATGADADALLAFITGFVDVPALAIVLGESVITANPAWKNILWASDWLIASGLEKVPNAHMPELCLAWMLKLNSTDLKSSATYRRVFVACPVDVEVYDSQGVLVAKVENDTFVEVPGSYIGGYVYENESGEGEKVFVLPSDEEYTVKVSATDDGMMTYEVSEMDVVTGERTKIVAYDDVIINGGDEFLGLVENMDDDRSVYSLTDSDGEDLTPTRTSETSVAVDKDWLSWETIKNENVAENTVASNLILPTAGLHGSRIVWTSSNESVILPDGTVTRPSSSQGNKNVTLTASISIGDVSDTVVFNLTVSALSGGGSYGGGGGGGGGTSSYTVSFETNGGNVIAKATVKRNEKVSKPIDPTKDGVVFAGWYADKELTQEYDFDKAVMSNITIYAKWTEKETELTPPTPASSEWQNPFTDVKSSDWFYDDVEYVVTNGLFNGTSATAFTPNDTMTRAMLVTVLWRLMGSPAVNGASFSDVPSGQWYSDAVAWAEQNDIASGIGEDLFAPDAEITREQMATILYRYEHFSGKIPPDIAEAKSFADETDTSEWATTAVAALVSQGIINGNPGNLFAPNGTATRAEVAAVLHRFLEAIK